MLAFIISIWLAIAASVSATPLDDCLANAGATLIYPKSSSYANLTKPAILEFTYHPHVVVIPSSTLQVARIVKCVSADKGETTLTVASGGHNYVGYAFIGDVVIRSDKMTDIAIDDVKKQVTVQFGQKLGTMAKAIGKKGYALPHGMYSTAYDMIRPY